MIFLTFIGITFIEEIINNRLLKKYFFQDNCEKIIYRTL